MKGILSVNVNRKATQGTANERHAASGRSSDKCASALLRGLTVVPRGRGRCIDRRVRGRAGQGVTVCPALSARPQASGNDKHIYTIFDRARKHTHRKMRYEYKYEYSNSRRSCERVKPNTRGCTHSPLESLAEARTQKLDKYVYVQITKYLSIAGSSNCVMREGSVR